MKTSTFGDERYLHSGPNVSENYIYLHFLKRSSSVHVKINMKNKWKRIDFSMLNKKARYFYVLDVVMICNYSKVNL